MQLPYELVSSVLCTQYNNGVQDFRSKVFLLMFSVEKRSVYLSYSNREL